MFATKVAAGLLAAGCFALAAGKTLGTPMEITIADQGSRASVTCLGPSAQVFMELHSEEGSMVYDFLSKKDSYHVSATVSPDLRGAQFRATYRGPSGQVRTVAFSGNDLASPGFAPMREVALDPDVVEAWTEVLLGLPRTTENLTKMTAIGLTLLPPATPKGERTMAGMMYACEYWGCVLGGGGWQACGDVAYGKWGYH